MNPDVITRYVELRKQIFALQEQLDALKPAVIEEMRRQGPLVHLDGYDLLLSTYTAWEYSPNITTLQATLNNAKREERQNGAANIRERRDTLVLRSRREGQPREVYDAPQPDDAWESDNPEDVSARD